MTKVKGKQIITVPEGETRSHDGLINSSENNCKLDNRENNDWVIVKKQRVTILIPAITVAKTKSATPCHLQSLSQNPSSNAPQLPTSCTVVPPVAEQDKSEPLAPIKAIEVTGKAPALPISTLANQLVVDRRAEQQNLRQRGVSKSSKFPVLSQTSKIKRIRLLLGSSWSPPKLGMTLNQGLRASNLDRKIQKAGGLSKWLKSLGLDQFVNIFQGRSLNKYQLVNLTMEKLKDMGATAVGPRRKLIHAIDCVCQPYCFGAS